MFHMCCVGIFVIISLPNFTPLGPVISLTP